MKPSIRNGFCIAALTGAMIAPAVTGQQLQGGKPDPYAKADGEYITLSGVASNVTLQGFVLDYGDGSVPVELDDRDRWSEAVAIRNGADVLVAGRIDDDFLETTSIEAQAVVDTGSGKHFFASDVDEEGMSAWLVAPVSNPATTLRGEVKDLDPRLSRLTLDVGPMDMRVDLTAFEENLFDRTGDIQLRTGDIVTVSGDIQRDLFRDRTLAATTLVVNTTSGDASRQANAGQLRQAVREVTADGSYTTADLVNAQLEAISGS